jgi:orotidine-5'-phosphate decarboxylase
MIDRALVRLADGTAEEAVRSAALLRGAAGFVVGPGLIAGPGPATIAAVSRYGPVLVSWGLHGTRQDVSTAGKRLAEYGARWVAVQAAVDDGTAVSIVDALRSGGVEPVATTLDPALDDARVASLGIGRSRGRAVSRLASAAAEAGFTTVLCSMVDLGVVAQAAPSLERIVEGVASANGVPEALDRGAAYVIVGPELVEDLRR